MKKDMIPPGPLFHKPTSIIAAKNILYACIFLGILSSFTAEFSPGLSGYSSLYGLLAAIVILGLLFIITRQIGLGRKWARTLFLILFIAGMSGTSIYIPFILKTGMALGFLFILQILLQVMALVFLFSKNSRTWFNSFTSRKAVVD